MKDCFKNTIFVSSLSRIDNSHVNKRLTWPASNTWLDVLHINDGEGSGDDCLGFDRIALTSWERGPLDGDPRQPGSQDDLQLPRPLSQLGGSASLAHQYPDHRIFHRQRGRKWNLEHRMCHRRIHFHVHLRVQHQCSGIDQLQQIRVDLPPAEVSENIQHSELGTHDGRWVRMLTSIILSNIQYKSQCLTQFPLLPLAIWCLLHMKYYLIDSLAAICATNVSSVCQWMLCSYLYLFIRLLFT